MHELHNKFMFISGGSSSPQTAKGTGETADAVHALQPQGLGPSEDGQSRVETMGGVQDNCANVERGARVRATGIYRGI